jgi:hypothetical protein
MRDEGGTTPMLRELKQQGVYSLCIGARFLWLDLPRNASDSDILNDLIAH